MYAVMAHCAASLRPSELPGGLADRPPTRESAPGSSAVEFLNLVLIFAAAFLVLRKPDKERLAFRLLVTSTLLMVFLFSVATRSGLLPGVNY
jgi:hypothetical protein